MCSAELLYYASSELSVPLREVEAELAEVLGSFELHPDEECRCVECRVHRDAEEHG